MVRGGESPTARLVAVLSVIVASAGTKREEKRREETDAILPDLNDSRVRGAADVWLRESRREQTKGDSCECRTGERAGAAYFVARAHGKNSCTCPDYMLNDGLSECKHVRALVQLGRQAAATPGLPDLLP